MPTPPKKPQWSIRIATIAGIELRVHASFALIVVLFAAGSTAPGGLGLLNGLLWLGIVFTCVTAHEFAHSLMARSKGVGVRSITLLPIGGVSQLEQIPDEPRTEFAIAIVGPLTSLAIAAAASVASWVAGARLLPVDIYSGALLPRIAWFNLLVAGFNLLPAFPMDGGRVLRAALETKLDRVKATTIAARIGQAFAMAMIVLGMYLNVWLSVIGLFIILGATGEENATVIHARLKGLRVRDVMLLDPLVIEADNDVEQFRGTLRHTAQTDFPVTADGAYAGIVEAEALERTGTGHTVGELADRRAPVFAPEDLLDEVVDSLASSGHRGLAVTEAGAVVGLLRLDDLRRVIARARQPVVEAAPELGWSAPARAGSNDPYV